MSEPRRRLSLLQRIIIGLGLVVLVLGLVFAWWVGAYFLQIKSGKLKNIQDLRQQASITKLVANSQVTKEDLARVIPSTGKYPELGSKTAPITIVEFVDYQCPYCQRSAPEVRRLMARVGDKVRLIIRDFPITELHPGAQQTAVAANCVLEQSQELYWAYNTALFADVEHQASTELRARAQLVGADVKQYDSCVSAVRPKNKIQTDIQDALHAGVEGTPTFFVNGIKFQGALDERLLDTVIEAVRNRSINAL